MTVSPQLRHLNLSIATSTPSPLRSLLYPGCLARNAYPAGSGRVGWHKLALRGRSEPLVASHYVKHLRPPRELPNAPRERLLRDPESMGSWYGPRAQPARL